MGRLTLHSMMTHLSLCSCIIFRLLFYPLNLYMVYYTLYMH